MEQVKQIWREQEDGGFTIRTIQLAAMLLFPC
jgi:hypothetical protein